MLNLNLPFSTQERGLHRHGSCVSDSLGVEKGALSREGAGQSLGVSYPRGLSLEARPRWSALYPEVLGGDPQQGQRRGTEVRPTGTNTGISGQEIPFL